MLARTHTHMRVFLIRRIKIVEKIIRVIYIYKSLTEIYRNISSENFPKGIENVVFLPYRGQRNVNSRSRFSFFASSSFLVLATDWRSRACRARNPKTSSPARRRRRRAERLRLQTGGIQATEPLFVRPHKPVANILK